MINKDGVEIKIMPSLGCISGTICNVLRYNKFQINEEELYCSNKLLELRCCPEMGLMGSMEEVCIESLKKQGIGLNEITILDYEEFLEKLHIYKSLLINGECQYFKYASVFKNVQTRQKRHFIMCYLEQQDVVKICDSFVPTSVASVYEGIGIAEYLVNTGNKYFYLNLDAFSTMKMMDFEHLIIECIEKYFECIKKNVFEKMQEQIIRNRNLKDFFYESATSIAVSGVYLSRKIFCGFLEKSSYVDMNDIQEVKAIIQRYIQLRILLLKYYLVSNDDTLKLILNQLEEIKKKEILVYERINRNIRI